MNPVSAGAIRQPSATSTQLVGTLSQRAEQSGKIFLQTSEGLTTVSDVKTSIDNLYHSYKNSLTPTMKSANTSDEIRDAFITEFPKAIGIPEDKAPTFSRSRGFLAKAKITDTYTRALAQAYLDLRSQAQVSDAKEPDSSAPSRFSKPPKGHKDIAMAASTVDQQQQANWAELAALANSAAASYQGLLVSESTGTRQEQRAESKVTAKVPRSGLFEAQKLADWDTENKRPPRHQDPSDSKSAVLESGTPLRTPPKKAPKPTHLVSKNTADTHTITRLPSQDLLAKQDAQALSDTFSVGTNVVGDNHLGDIGSASGSKDEFLHIDSIVLEEHTGSADKTPNDFEAHKARLSTAGVPVGDMSDTFLKDFQRELSKIVRTGNAQQGSGSV
jgi:hypothetical protein